MKLSDVEVCDTEMSIRMVLPKLDKLSLQAKNALSAGPRSAAAGRRAPEGHVHANAALPKARRSECCETSCRNQRDRAGARRRGTRSGQVEK